MILQSCRALARWSHISSQYLDKRGALSSLAVNITRVSLLQQPSLSSNEITRPTITTFNASLSCRPYATNAVSRPKAHTGRTTGRPRKQASATEAITTAAAGKSAAKKPAAKEGVTRKTKSKAKPKSKPRTKAKSTKARKKATKTKKPKLTAEQKAQQGIKDLKKKALSPPKALPASAFSVLLTEMTQEARRPVAEGAAGGVAKTCSRRYQSLSPEEREVLCCTVVNVNA